MAALLLNDLIEVFAVIIHTVFIKETRRTTIPHHKDSIFNNYTTHSVYYYKRAIYVT